jgi:cysteine-rich repeat protein
MSTFARLVLVSLMTSACSADVDDLFAGSGPTGGSGGSGGEPSVGAGPSVGGGPSAGGGPSVGGGPSAGGGPVGGAGGGGPGCGDGVASGGEDCDGDDLAGVSCEDYGFTNPLGLACNASCAFDPSGCAATCDGLALEAGELCDGEDLGAATCLDFGFGSPDGLTCVGCQVLDSSGCAADCGNGVQEPGEACDGGDNPATCVDLGFSNPSPIGPGCSPACTPTPTGCFALCGDGNQEPTEACDDGNVTPGDGCSATCQLEQGGSCGAATALSIGYGMPLSLSGTTAGASAALTTADVDCTNASGKEVVYAITVTEPGFFTAWLDRAGTTFDSVLYVRTDCEDDATTTLCADSSLIEGNQFAGGGEVVSIPVQDNQTVFLVVDGAFAGDEGNYALSVDVSAGTNCFDPIPFPIWAGTPMKALGSTNNQTATAQGECGGNSADDVVYELRRRTPTITNMLTSLEPGLTDFDSLLHVRTNCNSGFSEVACDNAAGDGGELVDLLFMNNDTRFVWVDGFQGAEGNYALVVAPSPP